MLFNCSYDCSRGPSSSASRFLVFSDVCRLAGCGNLAFSAADVTAETVWMCREVSASTSVHSSSAAESPFARAAHANRAGTRANEPRRQVNKEPALAHGANATRQSPPRGSRLQLADVSSMLPSPWQPPLPPVALIRAVCCLHPFACGAGPPASGGTLTPGRCGGFFHSLLEACASAAS